MILGDSIYVLVLPKQNRADIYQIVIPAKKIGCPFVHPCPHARSAVRPNHIYKVQPKLLNSSLRFGYECKT
jgi:hypothetical protein